MKGITVIREILAAAGPRPRDADEPSAKGQYAVRFAERMAKRIETDLDPRLPGITATPKKTAGSVIGAKQLDVNFSTQQLGLALGISLKSVHTRDTKSGRYTHNMKRNEEELRIEASGYHKRQPYAVMIGVLFLPFDSCDDSRKSNPSSFGSWVRHLRPYAGREEPEDEIDRFEKIYIGLYEPDGSELMFFDTERDPPRSGRPAKATTLVSYEDFLDAVYHRYLRRNLAEFRWADGEEEPLEPSELRDIEEGEGEDS